MKGKFILFFISSVFLLACNSLNKPNISDINFELSIKRFDIDLFSVDTSCLDRDIESISSKYGRYWKLYNMAVIGTGDPAVEDFNEYVRKFITDKDILEVNDSCKSTFRDISEIEKKLSLSFRYMKYYFPQISVPEVYFHISGFNQSIVVDSSLLSVSVDNYLGEKCKFYDMLPTPIPLYARTNMKKERIPFDVIRAIAMTTFPFKPAKMNLISNIIYQGKVLYFVSNLFPDKDEADIMGYSSGQFKWCSNNEESIWAFFVENDYIYTSDFFIISKYINNAPYTSGMPKESPGRVATWIGLQIVKEYMKYNNSSLKDLMNNNDYDRILRESNYQPE